MEDLSMYVISIESNGENLRVLVITETAEIAVAKAYARAKDVFSCALPDTLEEAYASEDIAIIVDGMVDEVLD